MVWRYNWPCTMIPSNKKLRIEVLAAATVYWTTDNWQTKKAMDTMDTQLGMHVADIDLENKKSGEIKFTFFWKEANHWEGKDFVVKIKSK